MEIRVLRALALAAVLSVGWLGLAGVPASLAEAGIAGAAVLAAGALGARFTVSGPARTPAFRKLQALFWAARAGLTALVRMPRLCARSLARARPGEFVRVLVDAPTDLGRAVSAGGLALSGAGVLVDVDGAGVLLHVTGPGRVARADVQRARKAGSSIAGRKS